MCVDQFFVSTCVSYSTLITRKWMHHIHEFLSMLLIWEYNIQQKGFFLNKKLQSYTVSNISPKFIHPNKISKADRYS